MKETKIKPPRVKKNKPESGKFYEFKVFILEIFEGIDKDGNEKHDKKNKIFTAAFTTLVILNLIAIIFGSTEDLNSSLIKILLYFEVFSVVIFTIEYILRIMIANLRYNARWTKEYNSIIGRSRKAEAERARLLNEKEKNIH